MTVRIDDRVAEQGRDPVLELVGQNVLEDLGLLVHLVPRHAEGLGEIGLEEAVMADHLEGDLAAGIGELDAPVGSVLDETHRPSFFSMFVAEAGLTDIFSAIALVDTGFRARVVRPLLEGEDALQVVLGGGRSSGAHEQKFSRS